MKNGNSGFTLIEIMVVILILGIMAAVVRASSGRLITLGTISAAKQDIATITQALNLYKLDNQRYPTTEQGLAALVKKPTISPIPANWKSEGYLDRVPKDPWGTPYQYLQPGVHGAIDVFSLGADKTSGGEGNDADIGSWQD